MKTKVCRKCKEPKLIDEFGRSARLLTQGDQDGRNIYCKECVRTTVAARRAMLPKKPKLPRKPRGKRPQIKPVEVNRPIVLSAIESGHNSREAIHEHTKLSMDEIVDALADLTFETEELRTVKKGDTREFYLRHDRDQLAA